MSGALAPPPDGALFDLDGVIIDSRSAVRTAVSRTLRDHGLASPRDPAEFDRFIGPPVLAAFAELTGEPESSALVAACADTYHRHYESVYLEQTVLVDGIAAVLERLTLPLALATAKPAVFVAPLLDALALTGRFRFVSAPAMSSLQERKTVTVARALSATGARSAVMVGDRCFDVDAAHANGARAIAVTWGIGDRAELEGSKPEVIVDRPEELLALLGD